MDFNKLKKYFKRDGEEVVATTFEEFVEALRADKDVKLYDLAEGGYVGKDKLDAKIAELATVKAQLEEANTEIKTFKDLDIEGIKKKADDWEKKYQQETKNLQDKLDKQAYEFAVKDLASGLKFTSASAKKAFLQEITSSKLTMKDGKVMGFDDFVSSYRQNDPDAFAKEAPADPEPKEVKPKPKFTEQKTSNSSKKLSLAEMMKKANEGTSVDTLFQ